MCLGDGNKNTTQFKESFGFHKPPVLFMKCFLGIEFVEGFKPYNMSIFWGDGF